MTQEAKLLTRTFGAGQKVGNILRELRLGESRTSVHSMRLVDAVESSEPTESVDMHPTAESAVDAGVPSLALHRQARLELVRAPRSFDGNRAA
jgi:hypothetical protein